MYSCKIKPNSPKQQLWSNVNRRKKKSWVTVIFLKLFLPHQISSPLCAKSESPPDTRAHQRTSQREALALPHHVQVLCHSSLSRPIFHIRQSALRKQAASSSPSWMICNTQPPTQSVQSLSHVWLFGPHGLQHTRPPCPSPTPGACSNSCPSSQWCHPTISSSVTPFSSCSQSSPASGSFPVSQFFP